MTSAMRTRLCAAILLAVAFACTAVTAKVPPRARANSANASATEQVWAQEEAYWRYVKSHNANGYLSLWADDFMGWPIVDEHPAGKDSIRGVLKRNGGSLGHVASYKLQRESVRAHGPVVITFYRATVTRQIANGSKITTTYRMTHTWIKRGGKWQIIGGMSAVDPAQESNSGR